MLGLGFERDKISGNVTHQIPEIKIFFFFGYWTSLLRKNSSVARVPWSGASQEVSCELSPRIQSLSCARLGRWCCASAMH